MSSHVDPRFHFNSSAEDITKTRLFKYAENFTTKKMKIFK